LELLVVGVIALIVFGPQKLPEMARTVGRALNELKRMASEVRSEFEMGLDDVEDEPEEPAPSTPAPAPEAEAKPPTEPPAGAGTEEGGS
jgi:Tat protein translocase TatB subunit